MHMPFGVIKIIILRFYNSICVLLLFIKKMYKSYPHGCPKNGEVEIQF